MNYLFTSERLGFRPWTLDDEEDLFSLTSNEEVMRYFDSCLNRNSNKEFLKRLMLRYTESAMTYFATELLSSQRFIGFIGLSPQTYDAPFNPSVDIGWRLLPEFWHQGLATEGAKRCLKYGFEECGLDEIVAVCSVVNEPSEQVMKRIGMQKIRYFKHVFLEDYPEIQPCVQYAIKKESVISSD